MLQSCKHGSYSNSSLDAQSYQWRCLALNETDRSYRLPDLPLNDTAAAQDADIRISNNTFFNFLLPQDVNCSGTVTSLRFCYASNGRAFRQRLSLNFTLRRGRKLSPIPFHSIPRDEICTWTMRRRQFRLFCCDTILLNITDQFSLPLENFSFTRQRSAVRLLAYSRGQFPSLLIDHYRISFLTSLESV